MERRPIRQGISVFNVVVCNIKNRRRRVNAQTGYRLLVRESDDGDGQVLVASIKARETLVANPVTGVEDEGFGGHTYPGPLVRRVGYRHR